MKEVPGEEVYVAARVLEAIAKSDPTTTVEATVYARLAESVNSGGLDEYDGVGSFLDDLESEMSEEERRSGGGRALDILRLALEEVRENGRAEIVGEVDEAVVSRIRSEFDREG